MSIFLSLTIGLTSAYAYDRRECKRLQREYIEQVKHLSKAPLDSLDLARKIKVYGARVPEDGELDRSSKWFKRYMRPILVASGTDYSLTTGTNPGGLGRTIVAEIRARRLASASKEALNAASAYSSDGVVMGSVLEERDAKAEVAELEGGIVLLGRGALKEYLWALRRGFDEDIDLVEEARLEGMGLGAGERRKDGRWEREEEVMVRELDREDMLSGKGPFDVVDLPAMGDLSTNDDSSSSDDHSTRPAPTSLAGAYAPYRNMAILPTPSASSPSLPTASSSRNVLPAPHQLPQQPPILLVPFSHPFGVRQWPFKMLHFFNHRQDVRIGGECALMVINAKSRPLANPVIRVESGELQGMLDDKLVAEVRVGQHKDLTMEEGVPTGSKDLDYLLEVDEIPSVFRKSYRTLPSAHEFARRNYYTVELPPKLAQARELAAGRTPTTAEEKNPPKMESELRKDRLEKELRWRRELEGWATRRSGSGLAWNERWGSGEGGENPFTVFLELTRSDREEMKQAKKRWEEEEESRNVQYELL